MRHTQNNEALWLDDTFTVTPDTTDLAVNLLLTTIQDDYLGECYGHDEWGSSGTSRTQIAGDTHFFPNNHDNYTDILKIIADGDFTLLVQVSQRV
jgi:hypothetical protein|uniref:hypothetical protein n=1 Tax=Serratia proteamaculans TaxID=28151 RepID=UPI001F4C1353|nr:hypothetical protein [Serratia proteamaculans]ULG15752.1 hypothetical protein 495p1_00146 [Serratia proteamaculans]